MLLRGNASFDALRQSFETLKGVYRFHTKSSHQDYPTGIIHKFQRKHGFPGKMSRQGQDICSIGK